MRRSLAVPAPTDVPDPLFEKRLPCEYPRQGGRNGPPRRGVSYPETLTEHYRTTYRVIIPIT